MEDYPNDSVFFVVVLLGVALALFVDLLFF